MSRFILGDCVRVMATFPGNAVDFILTDPPYLVGFRDRSGRTIAGDKTGSVAKIVKLEHAWRRLDGRNDDGFQVAPFPG